jgi:ribonuclease HI
MYSIYIDGAARGNPGPSAAGFVVLDGKGEEIHRYGRALGSATNNCAEYKALIEALNYLLNLADQRHIGRRIDAQAPVIYSDSELLVHQMNGRYRVRNPNLIELNRKAKELIGRIGYVRIVHIPRSQNRTADRIVNRILDGLEYGL